MDKEPRPVLLSLHPEWAEAILNGRKTAEVRKRAPLQPHPYKVYIYCTYPPYGCIQKYCSDGQIREASGHVIGEAICFATVDYDGPFDNRSFGKTCLTPEQISEYAGSAKKLSCMYLRDPVTYDIPVPLSVFGLKRPPQSWQYLQRGPEQYADGKAPLPRGLEAHRP